MKKLLSLFLALTMCFSLAACGGGEEAPDAAISTLPAASNTPVSNTTKAPISSSNSSDDGSWAVYWYLCGSDLETNGGFATIDLQEMMEVQLPENVNVVIQTGGANVWQNDLMDPSKIQRWLFSSKGLELVDEQETTNMGDAQTLYDFLYFANENFPADKVAVTFWNHGGGSVSGAAFDEIHGLDSLDLAEMYAAFNEELVPLWYYTSFRVVFSKH